MSIKITIKHLASDSTIGKGFKAQYIVGWGGQVLAHIEDRREVQLVCNDINISIRSKAHTIRPDEQFLVSEKNPIAT
jgi:hypothetical protein